MKRTGILANSMLVTLIVAALLLCGCTNVLKDSANITEPGQPVIPTATPSITGNAAGFTWSQQPSALETAPRIIPAGESSYDYRQLLVRFRKNAYKISVPVNMSVYEGASAAREAGIRNITGITGQADLCDYYAAMVREPCQGELYMAVSDSLRQIQRKENLDQDEYVEFMARRVFGLVKPGEKLVIVDAPRHPPPSDEDLQDLTWWQRLFAGY